MVLILAYNSGNLSNGGVKSCSRIYDDPENVVITNNPFSNNIFSKSKKKIVQNYTQKKSIYEKVICIINIWKEIKYYAINAEKIIINDNYSSVFVLFFKLRLGNTDIFYWIRDTPDSFKERVKMSLICNLCTRVYFLNDCTLRRSNLFMVNSSKNIIQPTKFFYKPILISETKILEKLKRRIVVCIGAFNEKKNQYELIKNLVRYSDYLGDVYFEFYGDQNGLYYEQCLELAQNKSLNISFRGITSNVYEIYNKSSLTLLASKNEGMPRVVHESICCYTPIVSFNVCGVEGTFKNSEAGIVVEQGDYLGMIKGVLLLLNDYEFYLETINKINLRLKNDENYIIQN